MATNKNHQTNNSIPNSKDKNKDEYKMKAYTYTRFVSGNGCAPKSNTTSTTDKHNI